jgi:hypothetical protein
MAMLSWLHEWIGRNKRTLSRRTRRAKQRAASRRHRLPLSLEALETRTLLSAPAAQVIPSVIVSGSQFGGGQSTISNSIFLGGNFNVNSQIGGIATNLLGIANNDLGAEANLALNGKVGLDASYAVTSGEVDAEYDNLTVNQNYVEPTQINQVVNFTPDNTNLSYGTGTFSTTSPQAGVGLAFDANVSGDIGGHVAFFGPPIGGDTSFSGSVNQSLLSYDTTNGFEVLGQSLSGQLGALSGSAGVGVSIPAGELSLFLGTSSATELDATLSLDAGIKSKSIPSLSADVTLGSASLSIPSITLNSSDLQDGGVLTNSNSSTFASLSVEMGPLIAALFGEPLAGAAFSTDDITIGDFTLSMTPVSFELGPDLYFTQTGTVTPTNQLTYDFFSDSALTKPMNNVQVSINGAAPVSMSSVTFTPGVDTIGIDFTGDPIYVRPTLTTALNYHNQIDLDAGIQGTLTVGELDLSGQLGPANLDVSLGPLYTQNFDFADAKLATVYDQTFQIGTPQTNTLDSFEIGSTFQTSLVVSQTGDSNQSGSGSLRFAVESANILAAGSTGSAQQVIQLGPGTYTLQSAFGGSLPVGGSNKPTNLVIQGAGAGQTIIDASSLGDRVISVNPGATLTLEGVTLENGSSLDGGAINNQGTLKIQNCELSGNSSPDFGGAIFNDGSLTITNSNLDGNFSSSGGGAIDNDGPGTFSITNSTLHGNTSNGAGGAIYNNGLSQVISSTLDDNSAIAGGGIFSTSSLAVADSTLYNNSASFDGGGLNVEDVTTLVNDTITNNRANSSGSDPATVGGGIYLDNGSAAKLENSIVAGNYNGTGTNADDINGPGKWDSLCITNLIGTGGSDGLTNGSNGNQVNVANPGLGTFGNNGGPTQTVPLLPTSPAINAGNPFQATFHNLLTDQRGYSRIVGGQVDIGAVQYQYDLQLTGSVTSVSPAPGELAYGYTVTNNGPDTVGGATLTIPLPQGISLQGGISGPPGWTASFSITGTTATLTLTDLNDLNPGDSASFTIGAQVQNTATGMNFANTASVSPTAGDSNSQNNSLTLTVTNAQEGQAFQLQGSVFLTNENLFRFTDPNNPGAPASDYTATVAWGDGTSSTITSTASSAGQIVADPAGINVIGSHQYAAAGKYAISVQVAGPNGASFGIMVIRSGLLNYKLFHFTSADPNATASDFTATVNWGDGGSNTNTDGLIVVGYPAVSVVANPGGGFDVYGSHVVDLVRATFEISGIINGPGLASSFATQVGRNLNKVELFHFNDANPNTTANIFTATFWWGDSNSNASNDGSGTVSVVADPSGGFDVMGTHTYAEEGNYGTAVVVTGLDGTVYTSGAKQAFSDLKLGHITSSSLIPPTVFVEWGDGSIDHSGFRSTNVGLVRVSGGFDIYGAHTYASPGNYTITLVLPITNGFGFFNYASIKLSPFDQIQVFNPQQLFVVNDAPLTAGALTPPANATLGQTITKAVLFHFTDANPNATATDYFAVVNWGDGSPPDGTVSVVANSAIGGFDVIGSHTYGSNPVYAGTFSVQVFDAGGASTSASVNNFQVLNADAALTAGALTVPLVTMEGQSISNQVLFHFSDADTAAQASDFLAIVSWGDATFNNSNDGSNSVQVVANSTGGFDVVGSHTYGEGSFVFGVEVKDQGDPRPTSTPLDGGGQFTGASAPLTLSDPAVVLTVGPTFSAAENNLSAVQTLATFTDPAGPEINATPSPYLALIDWGDGTVTAANLTSQTDYSQASVSSQGQLVGQLVSTRNVPGIILGTDGQTFSVNLAHKYAEEGQYTVTITINHDGIVSQVMNTATVSDPALMVTAGPTFTSSENVPSGIQTVATFTDPAGLENDGQADTYQANVDWGDGTTSVATLANGGIVLGSDGQTFSVNLAHLYADEGTYTISTTLNHEGVLSPAVTTRATVLDIDNLAGFGVNPFTDTYGVALTGVPLASFNDSVVASASDFLATIDWGDGQSSTGTVIGTTPVNFTVTGSHNYAHANTYTITVTFADDGAGTAKATAQTTATINPATLTITPDSKSMVYGGMLPTLTASYSGFVNGDTQSSLTTLPTLATVPVTSDVGSYAIKASGAADPDYTISYTDGTLTIAKADQTIIWSNPANIPVGTPLSATQLDATVSVVGPAQAGALTYTPSAGTVLGAGSGQTLSVTSAATNDYNAAIASVQINVFNNFSGFLAPLNQGLAIAAGRTVPIKFQLTDANGNFISSLSAVTSIQIQALDANGNPVGGRFNAASAGNSGLHYDGTTHQFIFNWQTKGLSVGSYKILISLNDGTSHQATVQITAGHGSAGLTTNSVGGTSAAPGGLLGGDVDLYVDNSNGDLTADEQARIQDAVTAVDGVTAPYGVTVMEVTDPTLADVTLNMNTTSAVGGYDNGVLGCTTDAGQITIIAGWNFYAGSDVTQIGSTQYDFQTVVTHELGHALGLGHSTNSASVMYATLNTGTVNRALTAADLNVPDTDTTGACGLHAAEPPTQGVDFSLAPGSVLGVTPRALENTHTSASSDSSQAGLNAFLADWLSGLDNSDRSAHLLYDTHTVLGHLSQSTIDNQDAFWSSLAGATMLDQIPDLTGQLGR